MNKISVLYIDRFSEIFGGGQRSLLDLLEGIDRENFIPIVVLPQEGSLSQKLREMNIDFKIISMPSLRSLNLVGFGNSVSQLRRLIKDKNIDLVHANNSLVAIYAGIAAKRERIPFVWHVRISDRDGLLDRFLASLSTQIITISDAVNQRFSWMKNRESRVKTIYNGIDLTKFNPSLSGAAIRREFRLDGQAPLVGTVGRLDWYKGHKYFLRAAKIIVGSIPNCNFLIVGSGEKRKELENLVDKLKLNKNVIFAGYREDIPEILAGLDLFVSSSVSEGLGRSIIEAMAMQKPVVATNIGGIPEVVINQETGILVPARESKALAEAIIGLLRDKERCIKMGLAGRKLVERKFDIRINIENIQNLYKDILEN